MAFCRKCGAEIPDDSVFCNKCGVPVNEIQTNPYISNNSTQKKKGGFIKVLLPVVLIVVALGVGYRGVIGLQFPKQQSNEPDQAQGIINNTLEEVSTEVATVKDTWQEYIKTDEFGDPVEMKKTDPQFYAEFSGTEKTSISINEYDMVMATAISDYRIFGDEKGERILLIPVSNSGSKMLSISEMGHIKAKASDGSRFEGDVHIETDRFFFIDWSNFFVTQLCDGHDVQVVVNTGDGGYEYKFTITGDNFKDIYDEVVVNKSK